MMVVAMTMLMHESVHAEGDADQLDAYRYQLAFLRRAYQEGGISDEELAQALKIVAEQMKDELAPTSGKGSGNTCEECLKYGLNPNGYWGLRTNPAQLDVARGIP